MAKKDRITMAEKVEIAKKIREILNYQKKTGELTPEMEIYLGLYAGGAFDKTRKQGGRRRK